MLQNAYLSIDSVLSSATTTTTTTTSDDDDLSDFQQTFSVAPGQKHEKQLRFYRTTQKCGRKRKGNVLKYD